MNTERPSPHAVREFFCGRPGWWEAPGFPGVFEFYAKHCTFIVDPRPAYCDRGALTLHLEVKRGTHPSDLYIDGNDMWPRIYFHPDVAWREMITWMKVRNQLPDGIKIDD